MKIHNCYKFFAKQETPTYPAFKVLKTPHLDKGIAYDVYTYATIINDEYRLHADYVFQNKPVDIGLIAEKGFEKWLH